MGQILTTICDNCKSIIKDGEKGYNLLTQEAIDLNGVQSADEIIRRHNASFDTTGFKVICENCKKILDYLFAMRKEEMEAILKEIKSSYKLLTTSYCKCNNFQDDGMIVYGVPNGICYVCGKKKQAEAPLSAEELKKFIEEEGDKNEKI